MRRPLTTTGTEYGAALAADIGTTTRFKKRYTATP
jgi:hypothetical protein